MRNEFPIIDAHCHAGRGDGLNAPWNTRAPLAKYFARCAEYGIGGSVLFPTFHSDYAKANRDVARIVALRPGRLFGFAFVHARRDRGRIRRMVKTAVERYGFRGIKIHRIDAPITREVCEVARSLRLPVLYDVVGAVSSVEMIASEYPDISFIIPHLGSFSDDWRAHSALIGLMARYANIYTDTAGVRRFDFLKEAVRIVGPEKILFGSDGPWLHPGVELEKIFALKLSSEGERLVLGGNLLRIISGVNSGRERPLPRSQAASSKFVSAGQ